MHSTPGIAPRAGLFSRLVPVTLVALLPLAAGVAGCSALLDWSGFSGDAPSMVDAGSEGGEGGDAGDGGATVPRCGPDICQGCCNAAGICAGGGSTTTCGMGGVACVDCAPAGHVCSAGRCVEPTVDAAPPPPCSPSACPLVCAPVYETSCCKSDGTCGCAVQIPLMGACM